MKNCKIICFFFKQMMLEHDEKRLILFKFSMTLFYNYPDLSLQVTAAHFVVSAAQSSIAACLKEPCSTVYKYKRYSDLILHLLCLNNNT